jgi:hypothetical protein
VGRLGAVGREVVGVPDTDDGELMEGPSLVARVLTATGLIPPPTGRVGRKGGSASSGLVGKAWPWGPLSVGPSTLS